MADPADTTETALATTADHDKAITVAEENVRYGLFPGSGQGMVVAKEDVELSPQLKEIASMVGGVDQIPAHIEGVNGQCTDDCERCELVKRAELNLVTRDKGDLFGEWNGGSSW